MANHKNTVNIRREKNYATWNNINYTCCDRHTGGLWWRPSVPDVYKDDYVLDNQC